MKLKGKVAIITGGGSGIGQAIAIDLAKEGARIVIAQRGHEEGRIPERAFETEREITKLGGTAITIRCDVTKEEEVQAAVSKTLEAFGRIDVLVNNAGIGYYRTIQETPLRHWELIMRVNVTGPFLCIKAVLPAMTARNEGSIINISSSAAQEVSSRIVRAGGDRHISGSAYGASKAALERFTIGLAEELRRYNIAVNALRPIGPTLSPGATAWSPDVDKSAFVSPYLYMSKASVFLAAQDARGLTGGVFFDKDLCEQYGLNRKEAS